MLMSRRQLIVVQTTGILNMYQFKDIVYSQRKLHIRTLWVNHITALREVHHDRITNIMFQIWIILIRQFTPKYTESYPLSPLELTYKWYTVQNFSVHIPVKLRRHKAIGWELHVVDRLKGVVLNNI